MWTRTARGGGLGKVQDCLPTRTVLRGQHSVQRAMPLSPAVTSDLQRRPDGRQFYPKELFYVDWCHPSFMPHFNNFC